MIHILRDGYRSLWPNRGLIIECGKNAKGKMRPYAFHLVLGFIGWKRSWHRFYYDRIEKFVRTMWWFRLSFETGCGHRYIRGGFYNLKIPAGLVCVWGRSGYDINDRYAVTRSFRRGMPDESTLR